MSHLKVLFIAVIWFVCGSELLYSQTGKDSDLWEWSQKASHHDSIVKITTLCTADLNKDGHLDDNNNDGVPDLFSGGGTGVLIYVDKSKKVSNGYLGYVLTANHLTFLEKNSDFKEIKGYKIEFTNGKKAKDCSVKGRDVNHDLAVIWTWVPEGIEPAKVATRAVQWKDRVEFAGLGGDTQTNNPRIFWGTADRPTTDHVMFAADAYFIPGDSGGPGFMNGEVVSIISGGCIWWDGEVKTDNGRDIKPTYPGRSFGLKPIRDLLHKVLPNAFKPIDDATLQDAS